MYPETQERAYQISPELKTVTEKNFRQEAQKQHFLYHIIQHGRIETRQELMFIYEMLDPRFVLPNYPLWDMTGEIRKDTRGGIPRPGSAKIDRGLWWQYVWSFGTPARAAVNSPASLWIQNPQLKNALADVITYPGFSAPQMMAKARICQRVLPALRGREIDEVRKWVEAIGLNILFEAQESIPVPFGAPIRGTYSDNTTRPGIGGDRDPLLAAADGA